MSLYVILIVHLHKDIKDARSRIFEMDMASKYLHCKCKCTYAVSGYPRISGNSYSPIRQTYSWLDALMVDVNQLKLERTSNIDTHMQSSFFAASKSVLRII